MIRRERRVNEIDHARQTFDDGQATLCRQKKIMHYTHLAWPLVKLKPKLMIRVVCKRTCMFARTINLSVKNTIVKNRPADSPSYVRDIHPFFYKDISHLSICTLGSLYSLRR